MAAINQGGGELDIVAVAGDPLDLTFTVTLKDKTGATIPWATVSTATAHVVVRGTPIAGATPSLTSPSSGQWQLSWTAAETTAASGYSSLSWYLQASISGFGPLTLVAGSLTMRTPSTPAQATGSTDATLTVTVGDATVTLAVTVGGASVASVNGKAGTVVLHAATVTADAAGSASTAQSNAETFAAAAVATETSRAEAVEALLAPLASPVLTGTPTAPTAAPLADDTQIATTAYADAAVAVEKTRAQAAEALKAPLASPALTGTPTAPTAAPGTNTTQLATTAFVQTAASLLIPASARGAATGVAQLDNAGHLLASESAALTGDVTKAAGNSATTVARIQGFAVAPTAPTAGQVYEWTAANSMFVPVTPARGGVGSWIPTYWYGYKQNTMGIAVAEGVIHFRRIPGDFPAQFTAKKMGCIVATPQATVQLRFGIYADNGHGQPGTLLKTVGTITANYKTTPTRPHATFGMTVLSPGVYWLAMVRQGSSASASFKVRTVTLTVVGALGQARTASVTSSAFLGWQSTASTFSNGALPATAPTLTAVSGASGGPAFFIQSA